MPFVESRRCLRSFRMDDINDYVWQTKDWKANAFINLGNGYGYLLDQGGKGVDFNTPTNYALYDDQFDYRAIYIKFTPTNVAGYKYQVIYEEGGAYNGFNFCIEGGSLYFNMWVAYGTTTQKLITIDMGTVSDKIAYKVMLAYSIGNVYVYLNSTSTVFYKDLGQQTFPSHPDADGMGYVHSGTVIPPIGATSSPYQFYGILHEYAVWDALFTVNDVGTVMNKGVEAIVSKHQPYQWFKFTPKYVYYDSTNKIWCIKDLSGNNRPCCLNGYAYGETMLSNVDITNKRIVGNGYSDFWHLDNPFDLSDSFSIYFVYQDNGTDDSLNKILTTDTRSIEVYKDTTNNVFVFKIVETSGTAYEVTCPYDENLSQYCLTYSKEDKLFQVFKCNQLIGSVTTGGAGITSPSKFYFMERAKGEMGRIMIYDDFHGQDMVYSKCANARYPPKI